MTFFIRNIVPKFFILIVALQILNVSIDAPVAQPDRFNSNKNFNYIECYVEYFAEVILQHTNAIPESGHRHHKELQQHKTLRVICSSKNFPAFQHPLFCEIRSVKFLPFSLEHTCQFIKEINPPPPKA